MQAPQLFQCPACGGPVALTAASCPHCGYRPPSSVKAGLNTSAVVIGLAALLVAVGSFLPWATVSSIFSISRSGVDGGGDGIITVGIGIVLALVAVAVHEGHGIGRLARALTFLGGLAALALAVAEALNLSKLHSDYAVTSIGIGLFVVGLGGVLALAESAISDSPPRV